MEEQDNSPIFELSEDVKRDIRQVSDTGVNNCDVINERLKLCEMKAQAYLQAQPLTSGAAHLPHSQSTVHSR